MLERILGLNEAVAVLKAAEMVALEALWAPEELGTSRAMMVVFGCVVFGDERWGEERKEIKRVNK